MTADKAAEMGCTPLARIVGYADGATDPIDFPIAPKFALDKLLAQVSLFVNPWVRSQVSELECKWLQLSVKKCKWSQL